MFLKRMPYVAKDNKVTGAPAQAPTAWRGNDSQKEVRVPETRQPMLRRGCEAESR